MTYIVANPRNIPKERMILHVQKDGEHTYWFEGDEITPADAFSKEDWKRLLEQGFVVKHGR